MGTEGQAVRFRDCTCPGTAHDGTDGADDGDIAYLRPVLGWTAGAEAVRLMMESLVIVATTGGGPKKDQPIVDSSRMGEMVGPVYIRHGVATWNVVDEDGPVAYDPESIIDNFAWAYPIAEAANDLYAEGLLDPLAKRMNGLSGSGLTERPTRQTRRSSARVRSPRSSSSPTRSAGRPSVTSP